MTSPAYQKIAGHGLTWGGTSRVWLGTDHVLLVLKRGYVEVYRRFFFNDIQVLIAQPTHTGKTWNVVFGFFAALFFVPALFQSDVARMVLLCLAAPFVLALLFNLFRGPTCAFYVRTAVQTERLPALSRVRDADRFIARIEPLIRAAQGELSEQAAFDLTLLQEGQLQPGSNLPPVAS